MGDNTDSEAYIHTWVHGEVTWRAYNVCFIYDKMLHHMTLFWLTGNHGGFAGSTRHGFVDQRSPIAVEASGDEFHFTFLWMWCHPCSGQR